MLQRRGPVAAMSETEEETMAIHYRDASGRDIGVQDTPRSRAIMKAACCWADARFGGAITYVWDEAGFLYFGGPWLGEWDYIEGVYYPRGRNWTPDEPIRMQRQIRATRKSDGEKTGVAYYRVWDPSLTSEIDGLDIPASMGARHLADPIDAAESFFRQHHRRDCPTDRTVHVRAPGGELTVWVVRAEETVVFRARPA